MKKTIFLFCLLMFCQITFAQKNKPDSVTLCGYLYDAFTRTALANGIKANVALLGRDSTLIHKTVSYDETEKGVRYTSYNFKVAKAESHNFIIRVDADGYESRFVPVNVTWKKGYPVIFTDDIYLRRRQDRQLDEVVVTATKIKFYNKGDTLVYNADAFQLQEGSMLDALIAQLPGAKLESDGRIMVNGRFVESLMLNGRDFFKNDNTVLLDNLPAYMVNQIQVYEKDDEKNRDLNLGHRLGEGRLVMDVKLKRQYETGWLANAEGGYGSSDRYLGRLFAMRYTRQSTITLFGNANNVNDRQKPGRRGAWQDVFENYDGLTTTKRAGMHYSVEDKYDKFKLQGDAELKYTDNDMDKKGTSTDFLPGGDVYNVLDNKSREKNVEFVTDHELMFRLKSMHTSFSLSPHVEYRKTNSYSSYLNGSFGNMPYDDSNRVLDSLHSPMWAKAFANLIRRNMEQAKESGRYVKAGSAFWAMYTIPNTQNAISLDVDMAYERRRRNGFNLFDYNYYDGGQLQTDTRNRYDRMPQNGYNLSAALKHTWTWNFYINMQTSYAFGHKYSSGDQMHYRLDKLEEAAGQPLGWIADEASLNDVLDADNSYRSTLHQYRHTFKIDWQYMNFKKDEQRRPTSGWAVLLNPSLTLEEGRYNFRSTPQPQLVKRNYVLPNISMTVARHFVNSVHYLRFKTDYNTYSPSMASLVDKRLAYDPLNITLGNPGLKERSSLGFELIYSKRYKNVQRMTATLQWRNDFNSFGSKFVYDKTTGARTTQTVNVNGNWSGYANVAYYRALDAQRRLTLNSYSTLSWYNRVHYASVSENMNPERVGMRTLSANEDLQLVYNYRKLNIGLFGTLNYNRITSTRADFARQNTWQYMYSAHATVELPWKIQISSDLTMRSRRGYVSSSMNRDDLVWNMRLSKQLLNNRLAFIVDAWDILHNLSDADIGSDNYSRYEYYTNVIPRYVMARIVYRFVKKPKKK